MKACTPEPRRYPLCGSSSPKTCMFPTTQLKMLIEHRAGVMEYPAPRPGLSPVRSPSNRYKVPSENYEPNIPETEVVEKEPETEAVSAPAHEDEVPVKPHAEATPSPEEEQEHESHVAELEKRNKELEERVKNLMRIGKRLVAAMTQSRKILSSPLDDPETQELLDCLKSAEECFTDDSE